MLSEKKKKLNGVSSFNLILTSSYHPNEIENQIIFKNYLSSIYSEIPSSTILISGHDMNSCIGSKTRNSIKALNEENRRSLFDICR